jgi:hypothetical protein
MGSIVRYERGEDLILQANAHQVHINSKDRKVIIASGKKPVREYRQDELLQEITPLLTGLYRDIGIHGKPDAFDAARFTQSMVENFPDLSLTDVKVAFEMHILGDLAGYIDEDLKHYQQFSFSYYAKILKAYQQRRREVMHDVNGKLQLVQASNGRSADQQRGHGTLAIVKQMWTLAETYLMKGEDHFIIHDAMLRVLKAAGVMPGPVAPLERDLYEAAAQLGRRADSAVVAGYRLAIEAGNPPNDVERIAGVAATRRELLRRLQELGIDKVYELLKDAEQRCRAKYNIKDEDHEAI